MNRGEERAILNIIANYARIGAPGVIHFRQHQRGYRRNDAWIRKIRRWLHCPSCVVTLLLGHQYCTKR
jgi:hypothetical protein